jgi:hypothetical protein
MLSIAQHDPLSAIDGIELKATADLDLRDKTAPKCTLLCYVVGLVRWSDAQLVRERIGLRTDAPGDDGRGRKMRCTLSNRAIKFPGLTSGAAPHRKGGDNGNVSGGQRPRGDL